jgi:DNA (cytosine-5)-methyltransferase 1
MLNAADYGDATTRTRFFLMARKDGKNIVWPEPTHRCAGSGGMLGELPRWRAAREIIDWSKSGRSLIDDPKYKKKPLSINTLKRIARGLDRYGGEYAPLYIRLLGLESNGTGTGAPEAFTVANRSHSNPRSIDEPIAIITASQGGGNIVKIEPLIEPFILGQQSCSAPRATDNPLPTVATDGAIALVEPQMVVFHKSSNNRPVDYPVPSLPTHAHIGLVEPQLVKYYGSKEDTSSVDEPLPTITTKGRFGLVQPFLVQNRLYGREKSGGPVRAPHSVDNPLPAVTGHGAGALVDPIMFQVNHTGDSPRTNPVTDPLPVITTKRSLGLAVPVIQGYNGAEIDPRRLVMIDGQLHILDIRFRMLNNLELARAMGFSDKETTYEFVGNASDVTRQIGNAVPVGLAKALVLAIFKDTR